MLKEEKFINTIVYKDGVYYFDVDQMADRLVNEFAKNKKISNLPSDIVTSPKEQVKDGVFTQGPDSWVASDKVKKVVTLILQASYLGDDEKWLYQKAKVDGNDVLVNAIDTRDVEIPSFLEYLCLPRKIVMDIVDTSRCTDYKAKIEIVNSKLGCTISDVVDVSSALYRTVVGKGKYSSTKTLYDLSSPSVLDLSRVDISKGKVTKDANTSDNLTFISLSPYTDDEYSYNICDLYYDLTHKSVMKLVD